MVKIAELLVLSCLSACAYRAGGLGQDSQEKWSAWIPKWLRHSWVRDWLCPMCILIMWFPGWNNYIWWWLGAYGATGGFLSTYWDFLWGWDNYWWSGFFVGLAALFLIGLGVAWWLLLIRAFVVAVLWGGICALTADADIEEYSRGFVLPITMLIVGV